jgi:polar amino acid transport system permease protein
MRLFISEPGRRVRPLKAVFNFLLLTAVIVTVFWASLYVLGLTLNFSFVASFSRRIWQGFYLTVLLSAASLAASLIIGIIIAAGQNSRLILIRYFCGGYVGIIRGTPLITQIYLFYYIVSTAWGIENRFLSGVIILSIFEGAYISEIIRGSLLSIDTMQLEAAKAVGFDSRQTLRYVILPQLIARTLPALTGQFASIIKDSSLLSIIAAIELTQTIREISATNFKLFECYILLGVLYLLLTLPITFVSRRLERRFDYAH